MNSSMQALPINERMVLKGQVVDLGVYSTANEQTYSLIRQAARDFTIDELAISLSQIPEQDRMDGNILITMLIEEGYLVADQHIAVITLTEEGGLDLQKFNERLDLIVTDGIDEHGTFVEIDMKML